MTWTLITISVPSPARNVATGASVATGAHLRRLPPQSHRLDAGMWLPLPQYECLWRSCVFGCVFGGLLTIEHLSAQMSSGQERQYVFQHSEFLLTLQRPLECATTAHLAVKIVTYFDDVDVVSPATAATLLFETLNIEVCTKGLPLKPLERQNTAARLTMRSCCENSPAAWASPPAVRRRTPGLQPAPPTANRHSWTS
jgi:hypothetical protein